MLSLQITLSKVNEVPNYHQQHINIHKYTQKVDPTCSTRYHTCITVQSNITIRLQQPEPYNAPTPNVQSQLPMNEAPPLWGSGGQSYQPGRVFPYFEPMTHRSQPSNLNSAKENPSRQQSISEPRKYKEHSDKLRRK